MDAAARGQEVELARRTADVLFETHLGKGRYDAAVETAEGMRPLRSQPEIDQRMARVAQQKQADRVAAYTNSFDAALKDPDRPRGLATAIRLTTHAVNGGTISADRGQQDHRVADARHATNLEHDHVQRRVVEDPVGALAEMERGVYKRLPPADLEQFVGQARKGHTALVASTFQSAMERVSMGEEDMLAAPDLKMLPTELQGSLSHYAAAQGMPQMMNNAADYEDAVARISRLDTSADDGGMQQAILQGTLESYFTGGKLQDLRERLEKRVKGEDDKNGTGLAAVLGRLGEWTARGGLGVFQQAGRGSAVAGVDDAARGQAYAKLGEIRKRLDAEDAAGKFTSHEELAGRAYQLFSQAGGRVPLKGGPHAVPVYTPPAGRNLAAHAARTREILNHRQA